MDAKGGWLAFRLVYAVPGRQMRDEMIREIVVAEEPEGNDDSPARRKAWKTFDDAESATQDVPTCVL